MGTVVLSPQDCLSSPHDRQNDYLQSARRRSQVLMVPLPAAEDCARHDFSGGSPPGDGLLPVPQSHGQARAFSKRSKSSSIFSAPPPQRMASVPPPLMKAKLSRSSSAILPTPLSGSPPAVEADGHLLKGRRPFKVVQGNGPGNKIDGEQHISSKKFNDARSGGHKKMAGTNRYVGNVKVKGHVDGLQGSMSTLKPFHDDTVFKGQLKQLDVRNEVGLDRSHAVKGLHIKREQEGKIPVVTILQRPQSKEAAAELLTKFLQKSTEHCEMINGMEEQQQSSTEEFSDTEVTEDMKCTISSPCSSIDVWGAVVNKCREGSPVADAVYRTFPSTLLTRSYEANVSSSKGTSEDRMPESLDEEEVSWERWAGPSYINSPPPSALPLPRFSRKELKVQSSVGCDLFEEFASDQASILPSSMSPLRACLSGHRLVGINPDVVTSATKDLKRILNLDLCRT